MITRKEAIEKIESAMQSFKQAFAAATIQKFEDVTLDDGSTLQVDVLAVNGKATKDGLPVADGTYTLNDKSTIEIVGGVITEVAAPGEEEGEIEAAKADPIVPMKTPEQMKVAAQSFATATPEQQQAMLLAVMNYCFGWQIEKDAEDAKIKAAIDAYKAVVGSQSAVMAQAKEIMEQTFAMVKEIGNEEIVKPITSTEPLTAFQEFQAKKVNR
jgi:hypothetical protein